VATPPWPDTRSFASATTSSAILDWPRPGPVLAPSWPVLARPGLRVPLHRNKIISALRAGTDILRFLDEFDRVVVRHYYAVAEGPRRFAFRALS
jgi:hypothetical protein